MKKSWNYTYVYHMHDNLLPVTVTVGFCKPDDTNDPSVLLWKDKAAAWFPEHAMGPEHVAHEALHLAEWAQKRLGSSLKLFQAIMPPRCWSWNGTLADRKEEMRARLIDGFVSRFYEEASERNVLMIWRMHN